MIDELVRILKDEGSICWQVGNYVTDSEVFPGRYETILRFTKGDAY